MASATAAGTDDRLLLCRTNPRTHYTFGDNPPHRWESVRFSPRYFRMGGAEWIFVMAIQLQAARPAGVRSITQNRAKCAVLRRAIQFAGYNAHIAHLNQTAGALP
jgi:hypothetical protein